MVMLAVACALASWKRSVRLLQPLVQRNDMSSSTIWLQRSASKSTVRNCANITVLVPLTAAHWNLTSRLLDSIAAGTRFPCEVLFALSGWPASSSSSSSREGGGNSNNSNNAANGNTPVLNVSTRLQEHGVRVRVLPSSSSSARAQNAAQNRNRGAAAATMPILACLDADDLQHGLRIQAIEEIFLAFSDAVDFVVHKWFWCTDGDETANDDVTLPPFVDIGEDPQYLLPIAAITPRPTTTNTSNTSVAEAMSRWTCCTKRSKPPWANGHIVVRKEAWLDVLQNESLVRGEDSRLTADLILKGYRGVFVNRPLTGYCHEVAPALNPHLRLAKLDRYYKLNKVVRTGPLSWKRL